jgi:anti-sigma-K factor RskA
VSAQRHELHLLTGSYALDALPANEQAEFEKHLTRCPSCNEEVRGLRETAARLALAAGEPPPPEMRARVLAAVPLTRQLPPRGRHAAPGSGQRGGERGGLRHLPLKRTGLTASILTLVAAVAFLVVFQVSTTRQLHQVQAGSRAITGVLAAPDARAETMAAAGGGTVTVVVSKTEHEAVVTSAHLPALSGGRVYQLWVIHGSAKTKVTARSMGLLAEAQSGTTTPALASDIVAGDQLGITVEPAGGTSQPTTIPIVALHT